MLDPQIPLSYHPPEMPTPMQTVGGLMQLRSQITENALRNAQVEMSKQHAAEYEEQARQRRIENQSSEKLTGMLADPSFQQKIAKGDYSSVWSSGVDPRVANTFIANHQKLREGSNTLQTADSARAAEARGTLSKGLDGVAQGDDADLPSLYSSVKANVGKQYPELAAGMPDMIQPGEAGRKQLKEMQIANLTYQSVLAEHAKQADTEAGTKQKNAAARKEGLEADILQNQVSASQTMKPEDWDAAVDQIAGARPDLAARTKAQVHQALQMGLPLTAVQAIVKDASDQLGRTETAVETAKATAPIKINIAAATTAAKNAGTELSPEALDMAAEMYAKTGQLPALGMGNPQMRRAILNRAGEMHPGIDIASQTTQYAANKASLTGLQKNLDAVAAFEKTAGKNLDLLLTIAPKIIDSDSPWINTPLREVNQKLLGAADLSAYNAARQVAINEIAKVTSNPTLAGQLSDAARKEVENFIPANATLKQTLEVAKVLRQDMENRRTSYQEQVQDIQKRIGTHPAGAKGHSTETDHSKMTTDELLQKLAGGD